GAPLAAAVGAAADVDRVFDALAREPNGGLIVFPDISMTNYREAIISLAARHRRRSTRFVSLPRAAVLCPTAPTWPKCFGVRLPTSIVSSRAPVRASFQFRLRTSTS